jgi:hypothetical protein
MGRKKRWHDVMGAKFRAGTVHIEDQIGDFLDAPSRQRSSRRKADGEPAFLSYSINMTSDDLIDLGMKSCDAAHRKPVAEINWRQCNSSQS